MTRPFDMSQLMRQAQEVGEKLQRAQESLRHRVVEATVGGGMVTVRANGKLEVVEVKIDPQAIDPRDVEMLQDLIAAAVNQAIQRAQEMASEEIQRVTGLPIGTLLGGLGRTE
jgi:DNA-binding YbaB/EbfC family protein